ncbi:uncharacterized protein LOC123294811 [Chrysoperla carnea]|uniref:uncharacterized protein LOC123294811 n=1 Tax=Chrysoperla carnea TaxID=189513 RepID=UPI001D068622|nr:uncharacterized protein LOC123294811 [Chrysoperla carnea]
MDNDVESSLDGSIEYSETFENNSLSIKPKYYKQTYRTAWEQMPDFKGWLRGIPGQSTRAYCTYCQKSLHAHRLSLLKHTCTIRHQKAAQLNFIRSQKQELGEYSGELEDIVIAGSSQGEEVDVTTESMDGEVHVEEECEEYQDEEEIEETEEVEHGIHLRKVYQQQPRQPLPLIQTMSNKPPISTHVLDTSKGTPVAGLQVSLYKLIEGRWTYINESITNPDGRCNNFLERGDFSAGRYKLHYDVDRYFELRKQESLYPFIEIVFDCRAPVEHYHIPLLLTPFGYTTYRGT